MKDSIRKNRGIPDRVPNFKICIEERNVNYILGRKVGSTMTSVQSYLQMVIRGLIIVIAVYVDVVRGGGYK